MARYLDQNDLSILWDKIKSMFAKKSDLSSVATSGSYNDLSDTPNFKTINNQSLIGTGNIDISGGDIITCNTQVAGSTGAIYLYRYGNIVFATTNGAFRSSSDSIASGTKLAQTIPDGYKSVATVYAPGINKQSNNQRFSIGSDGSIYYYGGSAWTANAYFTACWITNDD